jgi:hypothetical protein
MRPRPDDADILSDLAAHRRAHRHEEPPNLDPEQWLHGPRMTQTEASLRLALYLIREGHATSDVSVTISARELTRVGQRPRFPVEWFLEDHNCKRRVTRGGGIEWQARYSVDGSQFSIRLDDERGTCDVMAMVASDARIIAFVGAGFTVPTRSSSEHTVARTLIGRAITYPDVRHLDLPVVVVPRSERSRVLAKEMRGAPRVIQSGLSICTVDRAGVVDGLPFPAPFDPESLVRRKGRISK